MKPFDAKLADALSREPLRSHLAAYLSDVLRAELDLLARAPNVADVRRLQGRAQLLGQLLKHLGEKT